MAKVGVSGVSAPSPPAATHRAVAAFGLPYPPYLRKVILRSVWMWLTVRCAYVVLMMAAVLLELLGPDEGRGAALHPTWSTRVVLVALTAFLVWWDRRRAHEVLLHANLGTRSAWFSGASLLTASLLDMVVQTLLKEL